MKKLKKITSLLLVALMVMAMAVPVLAAGNHTITITKKDEGDHTFEAYQIFKGEWDEATDRLSNIEWGSGVLTAGTFTFEGQNYDLSVKDDAVKLAEALDGDKGAKDTDLAKKFAAAIAGVLSETKASAPTEGNVATITGLEDGYYFIKDEADSLDEQENAAYTRYILEVLGDEKITAKANIPTVEKSVTDVNDSDGTTEENQDSADYDIGDAVPFTLTGSLPDNYGDYTTYKYVFHDTLSQGLTFDNNVTVYVDSVSEDSIVDAGKYTVESTDDGNLTISFADLKSIETLTKDSKIIVTYTATLNENAVIGVGGNENKVSLEFSNDPNDGGEGTGNTPEDKVIVFTYSVAGNKVDQDQKPLAGAKFTLYKYVPGSEEADEDGYVVVQEDVEAVEKDGVYTFEFKGIDDGQYKLVESVTPAGYNTMKDKIFTVTATHTGQGEGGTPSINDLSGEFTVAPGTPESEGGEFTENNDAGSLTTTIVNQRGSVLPSTGGIGTTIFYVVGGILIVGAGVLLVAKKRMSSK